MTRNKHSEVRHDNYIRLIKEKRQAIGLSHEELAEKVGVSRPAISFIESGKRNPSLLLFLKLCNALELDIFK